MTALGKIIASVAIAWAAASAAPAVDDLLPDFAAMVTDAERMALTQTLLARPMPMGPGPLDALQLLR
jgi:hypothetical protein